MCGIERLNHLLGDSSGRGHCIVMYLRPAEYGLQLLLGMPEIEGLFDTSGFCIDRTGVDPLGASDVLPENGFQLLCIGRPQIDHVIRSAERELNFLVGLIGDRHPVEIVYALSNQSFHQDAILRVVC
nr:hypothetical protein [Rhodococcus qingshengii]